MKLLTQQPKARSTPTIKCHIIQLVKIKLIINMILFVKKADVLQVGRSNRGSL